MGDPIERFPLFPLELVLLPGETMPLHIFEERYKLMIGECLDGDAEFGVVWLSDDGLRDVGCSARVSEVLERTDDGRMNILVRGGHPFRLVRRIDDMPYPAGDVEPLEDDEPYADPELADATREAYAGLVERATDSRPEESDLAGLNAYAMAGTIDFALDAKQQLLELRSEEDRLAALRTLFAAAMKRLEYMEGVGELARGNGKVRLEGR